MIEVKCPCCGGTKLEPDPPENIRTMDERFAFEREWDRRFRERQREWE